MGFKREVGDILVGTAAIEWGPDLVQDAFGDLGVGHEAVAETEIGTIIEGGISEVQKFAPWLAALFIIGAAGKLMMRGVTGEKEK